MPAFVIPEWIETARNELSRSAESGRGWAYRNGQPCCAEPTSLACLALQATRSTQSTNAAHRKVADAAQWLAFIQQANGAVGISESLPTPEWATPFAILVWINQQNHAAELKKATDWLLQEQGRTYSEDSAKDVGHDPSIPGWPWVSNTHSWLEPTVMAILALRRQGMGNHSRTRDGLRLIRDRALANGGWNIGNTAIYGSNLRPQPDLTGLALLALSGTQVADDIVTKACGCLQQALPGIRSARSLCWGVLGLTAWEQRPMEAEQWLAEAFPSAAPRPDPSMQLAYLLLASTPLSLAILGARS